MYVYQWSRDLDPYVLPRAQFGGHILLPPVPTTAGLVNYSYPDARWGAGILAAGHGLGRRYLYVCACLWLPMPHFVPFYFRLVLLITSCVYTHRGMRLPSSVQYQLKFDFKDIFATRRTPFAFTRPPFMLVSARIHPDLVAEHARSADETVSVSVVNITTSSFVINVFRVDRDGPDWPDRGGRGWLKALDLDWIAWEPAVEDITVLRPAQAAAASVELDRYTYFRVDVFDHTHDVIIHLNTSGASPKNIDMTDSPLAAHAAADANPTASARSDMARAWLPHYVFTITSPPTSGSGRIVRLSDTAPQSSRTLKSILRLLNDGLAAVDECHNGVGGGRDWTGDDPRNVWERTVSCRRENGEDMRADAEGDRGDGGRAWPFAEAFAYIEPERKWVQIECAGVGCRHRLPLKIAPLMMVASTRVSYPTREFIGTRLPFGGGGPGGGTDDSEGKGSEGWGGMGAGEGTAQGEYVVGSRELSETWVSDFLDSDGGMRLHIYSTDTRMRAGRLFVGVLGLAAANFTITAYVGKVAPLGTEAVGKTSFTQIVPYSGRMRVHHNYGGTAQNGKWIYFRLTLRAEDINSNTAATVITVKHARPMEELSLYLRKDEAPFDSQNVSLPLGETLLISESAYTAAFLVEDPIARIIAGWAVTNPPRSVGSSVCGSFGTIIGGSGLLGHSSALQRDFTIPREHTEVRIKLEFFKIDLWDSHTARLLVDGEEVWRQTFYCDVFLDGMCGNSSEGSAECGKGVWPDEKVEIDVTVVHVSAFLTLRVETDLPEDTPFADHRSWGIGSLDVWYQHTSRRSAEWVDMTTILYTSNMSLPPTEALDLCTPANPTATPGCTWDDAGIRTCDDTVKCSSRSMMYRLATAGEYFVGVYGLNVTDPLPFEITTSVHQNRFCVQDVFDYTY